MNAWLTRAALAAGLATAAAAGAQTVAGQAYSHILSAFTTTVDPRVLSDSVVLGPALRGQLGAETDSRKVYQALVELSSGRRVEVRTLPPADAARYASLPGVNAGELLFTLQAGELALLLQYAPAQKRVSFVEHLQGPAPRSAAPAPKLEVPKPAPAVAPAPVVTPAPAVVPVAVPAIIAPVAPPSRPAAAPSATQLRPTGPCVIKPVMSEQDLANCAAAAAAPRPVAADRPAPAPSPAPPTFTLQPPVRSTQCVIKPVMSDEELRNCGVRR